MKKLLKKAMTFVIMATFLISFSSATLVKAATLYRSTSGTINVYSGEVGKAVIQYSVRFSYNGRSVTVENYKHEIISSNTNVKVIPKTSTGKVSFEIYFNNVLKKTLVITCTPTGVLDNYTL